MNYARSTRIVPPNLSPPSFRKPEPASRQLARASAGRQLARASVRLVVSVVAAVTADPTTTTIARVMVITVAAVVRSTVAAGSLTAPDA